MDARVRTPRGTFAVAALALCGCIEEVNKPEPPDMAEVVASYRSPSGSLEPDNFDQVLDALAEQFSQLSLLCNWDAPDALSCSASGGCRVCTGLEPLVSTFETIADSQGSGDLTKKVRNGKGYMRIRRICRGSGAEPTLDPANGTIVLTMGFTTRGFDPVFGTVLDDCKTRVGGEVLTASGTLDVATVAPFLPAFVLTAQPIVRAQVTLEQGEARANIDVSLQLTTATYTAVATSFEVPDNGNFVFFDGTSGPGLRASNGEWSCDFSDAAGQGVRCTNVTTRETLP